MCQNNKTNMKHNRKTRLLNQVQNKTNLKEKWIKTWRAKDAIIVIGAKKGSNSEG
jgi:hypothetical protein